MSLDHTPPAPIAATRFVLRPIQGSDAGLVDLYTRDKKVARMTRSIPHPLPPGATENFIDRVSGAGAEQDVWVMDGSDRGHAEVMGLIALQRLDRGQSEVRFWVAPAFWGDGLASEALAAFVQANPHGSGTMFAEVFQDNPGSARVLTNCGFVYLGDAEAFSVARNAKVATWTYSRKL